MIRFKSLSLIGASFVFVIITVLPGCFREKAFHKKVVKVKEVLSLEGPKGEGSKLFFRLMDIAVDRQGNMYVADAGASKIYKLDQEGNLLLCFGRYGQGPGDLSNSFMDIAISDNGYIFVVDVNNNRINKFSKNGQFVTSCMKSPALQVAISSLGDVYVCPGKQGYILDKFDSNLNYIGSIINDKTLRSNVKLPKSILFCLDEKTNCIYILNNEKSVIYKYKSTGKFLSKWTVNNPHFTQNLEKRIKRLREEARVYGVGAGGLLPFADMRIDSDGNLCLMYIYEYGIGDIGGVVYRYRPDGTYLDRVEGFGKTFGPFDIDNNGNYYCCSLVESRIKKYQLER